MGININVNVISDSFLHSDALCRSFSSHWGDAIFHIHRNVRAYEYIYPMSERVRECERVGCDR